MSHKPRHAKPSATKRRVAVLASSGAAAAALLSAPVTAHAAPVLPISGSSDIGDIEAQLRDLGASGEENARDAAWELRNNLHNQAGTLPPETARGARDAVDNAVNAVFPGLIAARTAPAPAPAPGPAPAPEFDTGTCPAEADVCVDLDGGRSWLQENGEVSYGAVPVSAGGIGQETPRGTFHVNRKVKDEVSHEFNNAPMPYAIYFTYNGHAFHQGNVATTSAGCVRLNQADAVHYFNTLQVGDMVHIY
ncbi:L,D-transpeptidase [Corynebacterium halotolerans]|uniref:L,D-transpeptidase n=1 Tax=Corynebacterium halotolerans TaxID=225326 RepID=UPI003CEB67BE